MAQPPMRFAAPTDDFYPEVQRRVQTWFEARGTDRFALVMHAVAGTGLGVIFQVTHLADRSSFHEPGVDGAALPHSWAEHTLLTTSDFARRSQLATWLCAGLNVHVTHHLFPNVAHVHLRPISEVVANTAAEYGLEYLEYRTVGGALRSHQRTLRWLGGATSAPSGAASTPRGILLAGVLAIGLGACAPDDPEPPVLDCDAAAYDESAMRADLESLASPALDGRVPGTAGDEAARDLVAERFACLDLVPLGGASDYEQPFTDSAGRDTANVIGSLPGDSGALTDVVVITAHLDHFGDGLLGANDNASGLSGLLAIAQALVEAGSSSRTVVFAALGSEESDVDEESAGIEGAEVLMTNPPADFDPDDVVYNLNLDMIGTYDIAGIVYALGALPGTAGLAAVEAARDAYPELDVGVGDASDLSDNAAFCRRGVPYLFFWTEDDACYHEACDTADRIDYAALVAIANLVGDVTLDLANTSQDLRAAVQPGTDVCGL